MIDKDGFRLNVGIILANERGQLLWAKQVNRNAWQFPQGGMNANEKPKDTLFRELYEEVGLKEHQVRVLAQTRHWLSYRLPQRLIRNTEPLCIGQKQLWFLLQLKAADSAIRFDLFNKPEFENFKWVSYWFPLYEVVSFKREVYRQALKELAPALYGPASGLWKPNSLDPCGQSW